MSGIQRIVSGEIAQGKLKGKAMSDALARQLQNEGASKKKRK